jgi:nicotinamidase-related amidase
MRNCDRLVWMDVDTQVDFISTSGAFGQQIAQWNVPRIVPNLARLARYAEEQKLTTILATDAHVPGDPEFSGPVPPHCVVGTPGHRRVPETDLSPTIVIENRAHDLVLPLPDTERLVVKVHKQHFAVGSNPNFSPLMKELAPHHVFTSGVATQGCVMASIKSLLELGIPVSVVVDAVGPDIYEEPGRLAIKELTSLGVTALTTDEVCAGTLLAR